MGDIRFILGLRMNLIFLRKLDSLSYNFYRNNKCIEVSKYSLVIMKERKKGSLDMLNENVVQGGVVVTFKGKVNIELKFKSCNNINNMRQENM